MNDKILEIGSAASEASLADFHLPNQETARLQGTDLNANERAKYDGVEYNQDEHIARPDTSSPLARFRNHQHSDVDDQNLRTSVNGSTVDRSLVQHQSLMQEIRQSAARHSERDFHSSSTDIAAVRESIDSITKRYPDLPLDATLATEIRDTFKQAYEQTHQHLIATELNWFQRRYRHLRSAVSGVGKSVYDSLLSVGRVLSNSSAAIVATAQVGLEIASDTVKVAKVVATEVAGATIGILKDPMTYQTIKQSLSALGTLGVQGLKAAATIVGDVRNWKKVGAVATAVVQTLADPSTWQQVGQVALAVGSLAKEALHTLITDPKGAWQQVQSFGYDMLESLGIVRIYQGAKSCLQAQGLLVRDSLQTAGAFVVDFSRVLSGQISSSEMKTNLKGNIYATVNHYGERMKGAGDIFVGGVVLLGECTGVTDVLLTCRHAYQAFSAFASGDIDAAKSHLLAASMHGLFAAGTFVAIGGLVVSGGTSAAASFTALTGISLARSSAKAGTKTVLKEVTKEFVEASAKETAQTVQKRLSQSLRTEAIEQAARTVSDRGTHELVKKINKEGSQVLHQGAVNEVFRETAAEVSEKLLRQHHLQEIVSEQVENLVEGWLEGGRRALRKRLASSGLENSRAVAKDLSKVLSSTKCEREVKHILEEQITAVVKEHLEDAMEQSFKDRLRRSLNGSLREELLEGAGKESQTLAVNREALIKDLTVLEKSAKEQAEKLGKSVDEFHEEVVESAWKGVREGLEDGTRKVVREGIEQAFKNMHARRRPHLRGTVESDDRKTEELPIGVQSTEAVDDGRLVESLASDQEVVLENVVDGNKEKTIVSFIPQVNGKVRRVEKRFDPDVNGLVVVSDTQIEAAVAAGVLEQESTESLHTNPAYYTIKVQEIADSLNL